MTFTDSLHLIILSLQLGFSSVSELLLCRLDALDLSVRTVLHLSAVLGTQFYLLDVAMVYEEMFGIKDTDRSQAAMAISNSFDVAVAEGILEQAYVGGEEDDCGEITEESEEDNLTRSLGRLSLSLKGRKVHPFYAENRCLRFTHDSWKVSILSVVLDERKREIHNYVALNLERELEEEGSDQDDFTKQIRILKHWKLSGNFAKAAIIALDVGGQLMLLGLNSQATLLFDDVLNILKEMSDGKQDIKHGGISSSVLDAIIAPELEYVIKLNISKGKAYSTLSRPLDGVEAYQSALDVSSISCSCFAFSLLKLSNAFHSLCSIFLYRY